MTTHHHAICLKLQQPHRIIYPSAIHFRLPWELELHTSLYNHTNYFLITYGSHRPPFCCKRVISLLYRILNPFVSDLMSGYWFLRNSNPFGTIRTGQPMTREFRVALKHNQK